MGLSVRLLGAGKPLPPLQNWHQGELDQVPPDVVTAITQQTSATS